MWRGVWACGEGSRKLDAEGADDAAGAVAPSSMNWSSRVFGAAGAGAGVGAGAGIRAAATGTWETTGVEAGGTALGAAGASETGVGAGGAFAAGAGGANGLTAERGSAGATWIAAGAAGATGRSFAIL